MVDVEMIVPLELSSSLRDDICDVVDYDIMRQAVCAAPKNDLNLLTTAALEYILAHPKVTAATVSARLEANGSQGVAASMSKAVTAPPKGARGGQCPPIEHSALHERL